MIHRPHFMTILLIGTGLLTSACSVAPPMNEQETQIKSDLAADNYMPATRQIEITQTTRALHPQDPYLMAEFAAALIASERSTEAIPVLNQGLSTTPGYGRLWSLKGAALDQQERYAEARQHYDRALRITPNDPNVMANLGLSHALAGDPRTAEGWLRKAAAMPNASDSVRQNLALVLQLQGKTAEANKLKAMSRPAPSFPQMRQAYNPAPPSRQFTQQAVNTPPQGAPRARLETGPVQGQSFKSASDAVRAMAKKRTEQPVPPQSYPRPSYPPAGTASSSPPPPAAPARRAPNRRRR